MGALRHRYGQLLHEEQISEIAGRIRRLIDDQGFQRMLVGAVVRKEQALSFGGDLKQIDLLLEYEDHCIVVDYKSSQKYARKHQQQVEGYKRAIATIIGKPTEGRILYLLSTENKIVEV